MRAERQAAATGTVLCSLPSGKGETIRANGLSMISSVRRNLFRFHLFHPPKGREDRAKEKNVINWVGGNKTADEEKNGTSPSAELAVPLDGTKQRSAALTLAQPVPSSPGGALLRLSLITASFRLAISL